MKRKEAIKRIMNKWKDKAVYITSTGMISREFFELNKEPNYPHLPIMGSMGCAFPVGIGSAKTLKKPTVVIVGDADILMCFGSSVLGKHIGIYNKLFVYVLDNGCHASTGGQPTCSNALQYFRCNTIKVSCEKGDAPRIPLSPNELKRRFQDAICSA